MNNQTKNLFISWQSQDTRAWYVVGNLESDGNRYTFRYTNGCKKASEDGFTLFQGMQEIDVPHTSSELFPLFQNRVLSKRRPEYPRFISWLGLDSNATDMDVLERSNGIKVTDNLQTFSRLEVCNDGSFECYFFVHGLSHESDQSKECVSKLKHGEELYLKHEVDNPFDDNAILVLSSKRNGLPVQLGYCPRYLSADICKLLDNNTETMNLTVERIDENAPPYYQLMVCLKGRVKSDFDRSLLDRDEFKFVQGTPYAQR